MKSKVQIHWSEAKFKMDKKAGVIKCHQGITLKLFNEVKYFNGKGESDRMKGNVFNEEFGQGLSYSRAAQDVIRKVEVYFVKYSCEHLLEFDDTLDFLRNIIEESNDFSTGGRRCS